MTFKETRTETFQAALVEHVMHCPQRPRELVASRREPSGLAAELRSLDRYEPQYDADDPRTFDGMGLDPNGGWVKWSDVLALIPPEDQP